MATVSVADRVGHRLPRPIKCDNCGSPRVNLQKRGYMGLRVFKQWDLIWHCLDCHALVGCHQGTDIPLGRMADSATRDARYQAHEAFDSLWRGRSGGWLTRAEAYAWMAQVLMIPPEVAHIGMLSDRQCEALIEAVKAIRHDRLHGQHWKQRTRKKRRK